MISRMNFSKTGLLPRVIVAIILGMTLGPHISPVFVRFCATFNGLFGQLLGFAVPLIILGLVTPGIADLGRSGGRLLAVTVLLAYMSTIFAGCFAYSTCSAIFPGLLGIATESTGQTGVVADNISDPLHLLSPMFSIAIPPPLDVMTALLLAFVFGIGMAVTGGETLKQVFTESRSIIEMLIVRVIVPFLPLHIFGLFLNMAHSGAAVRIIGDFGKVIGVIFILHVLLLLIQFTVAGIIARRNPLRMLWTMLPAYMTALGTASSAATIPVTLASAKKLGIRDDVADFCIPLCATIHLSGSMLKITATALAICLMDGLPHDPALFAGLVMLLGVMMVAAPGIPGGAIMAATGVLQSSLGFGDPQTGLMIAIYLAIDSFGTAGNVTGDGAIAVIVDKIAGKNRYS
ncbi:MAG: dicarboxylate/amino acid:cation symporter [Planctomycetaceae bacterium]|nr:dicarboxylate/amino acid:cation symporter [Planctomycetaceae bacterium]